MQNDNKVKNNIRQTDYNELQITTKRQQWHKNTTNHPS